MTTRDAASERTPWWSLETDETLSRLESQADGISDDEARTRLEQYGPNRLEESGGISWLRLLLDQFTNPLIYILIVAGVVTIGLEEFVDAGFIFAVVLFNAVIGFFQEHRAERSIEALRSLAVPKATVVRSSREIEIDSQHLVPGDAVVLEAGDKVPADCRVLRASSLEVDESLLTGESATVGKSAESVDENTGLADRSSMLHMGTIVTRGRGRAVVVATGAWTQLGQIAGQVEELGRAEVPLLRRMAQFARLLSIIVLGGSVAAFLGGLALGAPAEDLFLTLVAVAVAAIPEGLPIVLTVTLAIGLNRMARRNVIIRRLAAVETLGSCSVIGSDKTGTLTQNRMTVQAVYSGGKRWDVTGAGYETEGEFVAKGHSDEVTDESPPYKTLLAAVLCNEANLLAEEEGEPRATGDPTEIALVVSAAKAGIHKVDAEDEYERWAEIPFDSQRRYAATFHSHDGRHYTFVKGAPEQVLEMSVSAEGEEKLDRSRVLKAAEDMATEGLRVLAMAYHESEKRVSPEDFEDGAGLTLLGLQGMIDPPREQVPDAIKGCQEAGIRVLMITGDHATTALAIARQLGIAGPEDEVLVGSDLEGLDEGGVRERALKTSVFARVSPEHKLRIVQALQDTGAVVAVTGDGVNDGPALRAANVGVAMGQSGTDVAKEASDVVVTDDNFASIFAGVEEGRVVFQNVRLVTFFLISTGIGLVFAVLASVIFDFELPFLPSQLLWLNLVTNGIQDVALAFEPGEKNVLKQRPRSPGEGVISRVLWERTLLTAAVLAAGTVLLFLMEIDAGSSTEKARTVALTTMVLFQIMHVGNCRSEYRSVFAKSPLLNPFLLVGTATGLAVHLAALHFGPAQHVLHLEPLEIDLWLKMAGVALSVVVVNELHKLVRRGSANDARDAAQS